MTTKDDDDTNERGGQRNHATSISAITQTLSRRAGEQDSQPSRKSSLQPRLDKWYFILLCSVRMVSAVMGWTRRGNAFSLFSPVAQNKKGRASLSTLEEIVNENV